MARSSVYIGIDLQPELLRFVVVDRRGNRLMSGERQVPGDGHSWSEGFEHLLQNDEDLSVETKIREARRVWGFSPGFASGICRSVFIPTEALPVSDYIAWEAALYLGESVDRFLLSWERGPAVSGGHLFHTLSVRRQEFSGFEAGLSHAGVRPALIEGRLFSGWNGLSRLQKKKQILPPLVIVLEEGELYRFGLFHNGALIAHGTERKDSEVLVERMKTFFSSAAVQPEELYYQVPLWENEEQEQLFAEQLSLVTRPLPSADLPSSYAIALSAALRSREVAS